MESLAIVGSGIAGLGCAWFLQREFDITLFEADAHVGGHANTVTVPENGHSVPIDTGFMVFNHVTYPNLLRLFDALKVPTKRTDMSFGVRHSPSRLEYCGSSLRHLFAQRRNLFRPSFYRMLMQIDRFNREAIAALDDPAVRSMTLTEYVDSRGYGETFLRLYLVPMSSAVWSTPPERMLEFPATTLLRFFYNHGFLGMHTQHSWWTVEGGSRTYVEKLTADFRDRIHLRSPVRRISRGPDGVQVVTDTGAQQFDRVIFACHPPTTLKILGAQATAGERTVLSAFSYEANIATLHTDESVMPRTRRAWAAWNYRLDLPSSARPNEPLEASTHYWMNRLQGVSDRVNYFVSINGEALIDPAKVLKTIAYEHPLFDLPAREAQSRLTELNTGAIGGTETYFAGAWQGYGFHEDGLASAVALSQLMLHRNPWHSPAAVLELA